MALALMPTYREVGGAASYAGGPGPENGVLQVRVQVASIDGAFVLVEPKTSRSRRAVPLPAIVVDALREHRRRQLVGRPFEDLACLLVEQTVGARMIDL